MKVKSENYVTCLTFYPMTLLFPSEIIGMSLYTRTLYNMTLYHVKQTRDTRFLVKLPKYVRKLAKKLAL